MESMELQFARELAGTLPWRQVRQIPEGPLGRPPDPHAYCLVDAPGVDQRAFWGLVKLIRSHGRRGRYTTPYDGRTMVNRYLELDEHVYWSVGSQLCRTLAALRQHRWLDEDQPPIPGWDWS